MKLLRINAENPEKGLVSFVAREVALGRIIIYPTDTVYGIGCRLDPDPVKKVFEIKNRIPDKPLSIAFKDLASAKKYVSLSPGEEDYIKRHLDKPMTYVVKKKDTVPDIVTGGRGTIGIRIIDNPFVRELLSCAGEPIITTSANVSGEKAPQSIIEISGAFLKRADYVIDCGPCKHGIPSRVVYAATGEPIREP
ncbi:MAG: L-threonylcarbamoyladenylate synthase [Candidatus Altiarchaeia archaeon]